MSVHRQSVARKHSTVGPSAQQQHVVQIGYPILKTAEIVECLQELEIRIHEEDILKPTAFAIQTAWATLLESFNGVTYEGFERPKGALLGMMPYPELLSDAVTFQMFFTHVRRLVKISGVDSFTVQDLTRPEPARVRDCFSAVINFAKFKLSHQGLFTQLVQKGQASSEKRDLLEYERQELEEKMYDLRARKEQDVPRIQEAELRNDKIKNELQDLKKEQTALTNEVTKLSEIRKGLKDQIQHQQGEMATLSNDINAARSRLVQSPDRLRRTISELSRNTNSEKALLSSFQTKARDLGMKLDQIGALEQDIRGLLELQRDAELQQQSTDKAASRLALLINEFDKASVAQTTTSTRLEQLDTQLSNANDKLTRAKESWAEKKERFRSTIAQLRDEYAVILKERQEDESALKETEKEIAKLTAETEAFVAQNQAEANALLAEYWRLREHVEAYKAEMKMKLALD